MRGTGDDPRYAVALHGTLHPALAALVVATQHPIDRSETEGIGQPRLSSLAWITRTLASW